MIIDGDEPITARDARVSAKRVNQHVIQLVQASRRDLLPLGGQPQDLSVPLCTEAGGLRPFREIEADVIRLALEHYRGRVSEVSRQLRIGRSTLYRKVADLGIGRVSRPTQRDAG